MLAILYGFNAVALVFAAMHPAVPTGWAIGMMLVAGGFWIRGLILAGRR